MKRCFAYCSIFPKDYVFKKDELVLLWMAEGFLKETTNKRMEEVGEYYFLVLASRLLLEQSSGNKSGFVMHDLSTTWQNLCLDNLPLGWRLTILIKL